MNLYKSNVEVRHNGIEVIVDIYENTRGGTKSPSTFYLLVNGRLITPYEQLKRGWKLPFFALLFTEIYEPVLNNLILDTDFLLKATPKVISGSSLYHQPITLGIEHGVTFGTKIED